MFDIVDRDEVSIVTNKKTNNYILANEKTVKLDKEIPSIGIVKEAVIKYEERKESYEQRSKLIINFKGFIKFLCRCCYLTKQDHDNNKLLEFGKKFLTLKLDLNYYLKMTDQINHLKILLLKPYQIFLLDNQKKKNLYSSKDKFQIDIVDEHFTSENEVHLKLIQLLIQKKKDHSLEPIDSILYDNIENNLKHLVEDLMKNTN